MQSTFQEDSMSKRTGNHATHPIQLIGCSIGRYFISCRPKQVHSQLPVHCSWKPDPEALAVDALSISWKARTCFHRSLLFPVACTKSKNYTNRRESIRTSDCPGLVQPNLLLLKSLILFPILLPPIHNIVTNSHGLNHPLAIEGDLPLAAWPVILPLGGIFRWSYQQHSSNHRLNLPIHLPGDSGIDGVLHETLFTLLSAILEFLLEQFNMGKQYHKINTLRSALSMTHEVDGVRVGQHPMVSRCLKGVFTPAPRYFSTWDVDMVLNCIMS